MLPKAAQSITAGVRLNASMRYGNLRHMGEMRKITAHVPADLLQRAQEATGAGVTETLRIALEQLAVSKAYAEFRKLRGKVKLSIDLDELREDRR